MPTKTPTTVRALIKTGLDTVHRIISSTSLIDVREVWKFTSPTNSQRVQEEFFGYRTADLVERTLLANPICDEITKVIATDFPLLRGHIGLPSSSFKIPETPSLLIILYRHVCSYGDPYSDLGVDRVLEELDTLYAASEIDYEIYAPVMSLKMPPETNEIILSDNVKLCALSLSESEQVHNREFQQKPFGIMQRVTTAIRIKGKCPVLVSLGHCPLPFEQLHDETETILKNVIGGLMIVGSGKPRIEFQEIRYPFLPISLFNPRFSSNEAGNPFGDLELTDTHIEPLKAIYKSLSGNRNRQIAIALERLSRSEGRYSQIDGVIDAVIGLEALLTPDHNTDMSFRLALNFALIGPKSERNERFKNLKELSSVRGKIVHGNQPMESKLFIKAGEARHCLRHALSWCLKREDLTRVQRFPQDFWTNYVFSLDDPLFQGT
jgi:hypothetical protein